MRAGGQSVKTDEAKAGMTGSDVRSSLRQIFDAEYYQREATTRALTIVGDPLEHFLSVGWRLGLNPCALFDIDHYRKQNPDAAASPLNPLLHYLVSGARRGSAFPAGPVRAAVASKAPARDSDVRADRRILVVDWRIPMGDVSAGERATVGILGDLGAIGFDVVFVPNNMAPSSEYEEALRQMGVNVVTRDNGFGSPADYVRAHGAGFGTFYLFRVDVAEALIDAIREAAPNATIVFHEPDLYFLRETREAELKNDPNRLATAKATQARELSMMRRVDHTVLVSPAELPVLQGLVDDDVAISVFPALYADIAAQVAPFEHREGVFFIGGFEHSPNVDGVLWFVAEVWPQVRACLPEAEFHIVGSKAPAEIHALGATPGVTVHGYVRDLEPLLSSMKVGVAPLRYGAGIKGKVATMMGAGMACVCTSIAAEGMDIEDRRHALIADDASAFAEAIVKVYRDTEEWSKLSDGGRRLIARRFGQHANRASLLSVLDKADVLPIPLWIEYCSTLPARPIPLEHHKIDVSIIVPVFNHWELTRACLNSVLEASAADDVVYEIILADDCSTDETVVAAQQFPGLCIVKTPRNLGFLRNCNNAAKHARGKYLLLLNNDTIVLPGWLSALHRRMEADDSIAIAGSKFLYPEGTIQEAGALLWNDASGHSSGRNHHRSELRYNYHRETDYVSGASVLIRRSFWDGVGGFDERYETAYCEDSDLAMAARKAGKRVVYVPDSEVIHFESQSYLSESAAELQRRNIEKLKAKWRTQFASQHHPPGSEEHVGMAAAQRRCSARRAASRSEGKLNILYFSPFPSHPGNHGNQATIREFGHLLRDMGHTVRFVVMRETDLFSERDVADMRAHWTSVDIIEKPIVGPTLAFDGWYPEGLGEEIAALCAKYDADVVLCSYVFHSKLLEYVPAHVLTVIDTHDKMGNRFDMLRANGIPLEFFSCSPEEEGAYLRRADIVFARQAREAEYFGSVSGKPVVVVPHLTPPRFAYTPGDTLRDVGLVASPNRINFGIVKECIVEIERRAAGKTPPFTFNVAGQVKEMVDRLTPEEAEIFHRPWVRMHGFVPDIAAFYGAMDLMLSPVMVGTGINVKTVEAMAFGMPLLTTIIGGKGIETNESMHAHPDVASLVNSLFSLADRPAELVRLAAVSRARYEAFYKDGLDALKSVFSHAKLQPSEPSP
jgi:GT2 family glycosyltransferase/glycosyltransferase involved in cell wall biosynthesis